MRRLREPKVLLLIAVFAVYAAALLRDGLVRAPGPHDNDWTLLMWLAKQNDLAALAVGHYGALQLVLVHWLWPVFGTTLVAAKVLNVAGTVAAGAAAYVLLRDRGYGWGVVAACGFLLWPTVYLTGQSEFGDPLALGFFAAGIALILADGPARHRLLVGGLLMGLAGCVRLHFQTFAWAAMLPIFAYFAGGDSKARPSLQVAAGVLLGQLPMFVINWLVHRTLFSPIAGGFVGQVVVGGANAYDMPATHLLHPMSEVLHDYKVALINLVASRLCDCPPPLLALLVIATAGVVLVRDKKLGVYWLLAVGYYVGFVTPSWSITFRLIEPFVLFTVCAAAQAVASTCTTERASFAAITVCLALAALNLRAAKGVFRAERARINNSWARNGQVGHLLRNHGAHLPLEVFAVDWWTHPVDDPEFVPYYNFGFWNLLEPAFAAERPNPLPYVNEPEHFFMFLEQHGVRYIVLVRDSPFAALNALCSSDILPGGYTAIGKVEDQCLFAIP